METVVEKIEAIMEKACTLFAEKGYEHTPIAEIAEEAGVASGTIIYHFKNKENLLSVLVWKTLNSMLRQVCDNTKSLQSGLEGVETFVASFFDFLETNKHESLLLLKNRTFQIEQTVNGTPAMDIKSIQKRYNDLLEDFIQSGMQDGSIRPQSDGHAAAMNIISMLIGSAWLALFFNESTDELRKSALLSIACSLKADNG